MKTEIRRLNEADITQMLEVARDLKHTPKEKRWFTEEAIDGMKDGFKEQEGFVVVSNGEVVGFVTYGRSDGGDTGKVPKGGYEIKWMGILRKYHNKGIGSRLLEVLFNELKSKGIEELFVETVSPREKFAPYLKTFNFYEKLGFKLYGEVDMRDKGPECWMTVFRKELQ